MILTNAQIAIIERYLSNHHDLDHLLDTLSLEDLYKIVVQKYNLCMEDF